MPRQEIYSCNEGNFDSWDEEIKRAVTGFKTQAKPFAQRYVGSMVSDVHRTLLYGGLFLYPADKKSTKGKTPGCEQDACCRFDPPVCNFSRTSARVMMKIAAAREIAGATNDRGVGADWLSEIEAASSPYAGAELTKADRSVPV